MRKSLPSPRKRKAVTRKLYEEEHDKSPEPKKQQRSHGSALSDDTINKVKRSTDDLHGHNISDNKSLKQSNNNSVKLETI